jgi:hypothetical protein
MKLSDISWGDDSAERDAMLLEYFVPSTAFDRLAHKSKSLVVGRKGAGKSALLRKLQQHFSEQAETFVVKVTPKYNSIKSVLNDAEIVQSFGQEIFFQHTWLRQLLLDALCCIGNTAKGTFASGSLGFARDVAHQQNRTSKDFVENIADVLGRVKLRAGKLGDLGIGIEKALRDSTEIEGLEFHLKKLAESGANVIYLVDDLDLGWDNSGTANNLLLGLLSAAGYLTALATNIHPFVFLREDVYTILLGRTQHADKFRNVERIRWDKDSLYAVLEARINYNRRRSGLPHVSDAGRTVFPDTVGTTNIRNWLVDRTLSRPRELIQLVRYYTESVTDNAPSDDKLKDAEPRYSSWKLDDLCAEYSNQYPGLTSVMSYWKTKFFRVKYHLKRSEIEEMILDILANVKVDAPWYSEIVETLDIRKFLEILYEIGLIGDFVLGGQGGSKTYYSFEESHEPRFDEVQIHQCFRRAVNTVERIRD